MVARVLMVLVVFGFLYGCGQANPPPGNSPPGKAANGGGAEEGKADFAIVRLTFDDGPVRPNTPVWIQGTNTPLDGNTPAVLDVLRKYRVKATFFVVGEQARKYPGLVRTEYSEGHSVQNHSFTHPNLTKLTNAEIAQELRATNQAITEAGVPRPHLFRPPYGKTDDRVSRVGASLGLRQIRWTDKASEDWEDPPPSVICKRVVSRVRPGSVVLLHDGSGANTDDALPCIIKELRARGYGFGKL